MDFGEEVFLGDPVSFLHEASDSSLLSFLVKRGGYSIHFKERRAVMGRLYDQMKRDLELRNFSIHTRRTDLACVRRFALYFQRSPEELGDPEIREYLHYLIKERNVSQGAVTQAYGALKFFYEATLKRDWEGFRIPKGKVGRRLPIVLSQQEVEALFGAIKNLKHRAILMTI